MPNRIKVPLRNINFQLESAGIHHMRAYHSAQMLNFDNRRLQQIGGSLFWHIWGRNHCNIFRAQQELHLRTDRMILGLAVQRKLIASHFILRTHNT